MRFQIEHLKHQEDAIKETLLKVQEGGCNHYAIEMETGTGKTFTFISTIFELYKKFNYKKFIIVVPRVAIKEGVYKTFEIFEQFFKDKHNNIHYNVRNYDKGKIGVIANFAYNDNLEILILTKQSFDKETNKLRQDDRDELFGNGSYVDSIKKTNPVVIIDEPQLNAKFNFDDLSKLLNPKFILSYSATHPKENQDYKIYTYSADQAYKDRQVKRLEYLSIDIEGGINATLQLEKSNSKTAKIKYNGKSYSVKKGDNLGKKTQDQSLNDYFVKYTTDGDIQFTNGKRFSQLVGQSVNEETILREQIKQTILQHKVKNNRLQKEGIKQISLFFVPSVSDFNNKKDDGIVKKIFLEEYRDIYNQEPEGKYAYYFSETANVKGTKDSKEKAMTQLILQDREKLLSLENEVQYIFAHTSLGVGWDNPNIFNICFLRHISSENSKKQFVGRGLRLCVNQEGKRIFEDKSVVDTNRLNNLTIIGSMQYETFCTQYQQETGIGGSNAIPIDDAKKRIVKQIKIRKEKNKLAMKLWQKLKPKTKWYVDFGDLNKLYDNIITELKNEPIDQKRISITKGDIEGNLDQHNAYEQKDIVEELNIKKIIFAIKKKTWLTTKEVQYILSGIDEEEIKKHQERFTEVAIEVIERCKKNHIMCTAEVSYERTGQNFDDEHFIEEDRESCHINLMESEKSLFNLVDCDSEQEKKFVKLADNTLSVELLVKLPKGSKDKFHINTPIGKYTPDFALLVNSDNKLYMVFEVKSTRPQDLPDEERFKIQCAVKHFEQLDFDVSKKYIDHKGANMLEIAKLQEDAYSVYIPNAKKNKSN